MKFVLTAFIISCSTCVLAQQKYDWSKLLSLPFKEDSVQSFNNTEVKNHIVYPIKESKSIIEIRFYTTPNLTTEGSIYTFQCFRDTIIANEYNYFYREWVPWMTGYEFMGKRKDEIHTDICRRLKKTPTKSSFLTELNIAIENKILIVPDNKNFVDSVAQNKIILNKPDYNCVSCNGYILCEIKVGNKYRNFRIWNLATEYYNVNSTTMFLKYNSSLLRFFNSIFRSRIL